MIFIAKLKLFKNIIMSYKLFIHIITWKIFANSLASILDLRLGHSPSTMFFNGFLIDSVSKLSKHGHDLLGTSISSSNIYLEKNIMIKILHNLNINVLTLSASV